MNNNLNGIILNDRIVGNIANLQDGYASAIAHGLDYAIGFLFDKRSKIEGDEKDIIDILETLFNAKTEMLALLPREEEGGNYEQE